MTASEAARIDQQIRNLYRTYRGSPPADIITALRRRQHETEDQ